MSQRSRDQELLDDILAVMDGPDPPRPDFTSWECEFVMEMDLWLDSSDDAVFTPRQREKLEEIYDEKC